MKPYIKRRVGMEPVEVEHCALFFIRTVMLLTALAIVVGRVL